jgi:hypothetical protein
MDQNGSSPAPAPTPNVNPTPANPTEKLAAALTPVFASMLADMKKQMDAKVAEMLADAKLHFDKKVSEMKAEIAITMQQSHAPLLKKMVDIDLSIQNVYGTCEDLKETVAALHTTTGNTAGAASPSVSNLPANAPGLRINEAPTDDMFKSIAPDEFEAD